MVKTMSERRSVARLASAASLIALLISAAATPSLAQGATLNVFGPSSLDQLGVRQTPEIQAEIQSQIFEGFMAEHPEVTEIVWDAQGPQAQGLQRLMTAQLSDQPMDLISCSANQTNGIYARRGLVRDITDDIAPFQDHFTPASLLDFTISGKVYGVPISAMSTSTFYYNVDLFAELGIEPPKTYDELLAALPKFEEAGVIPVLHQGANAPLWPMWFFEAFAQTSGDPIGKTLSNLAGETRFDDPADVAAFAVIRKWVDDGLLSPDSLSVDQDGMRAAFASGRSAMYYGGTWEISPLTEAVTDFEWGVFTFPRMPDAVGDPKHGGGADNGMCVSSSISDENLPHALAFMEYISRPEIAALYLEPEEPLATSIVGVEGVDAPYAATLREDAFPNTVKFLDWIWPTEVTNATASAIAGVVGGELTPEEAAGSIQSVFDELVAAGDWPPE